MGLNAFQDPLSTGANGVGVKGEGVVKIPPMSEEGAGVGTTNATAGVGVGTGNTAAVGGGVGMANTASGAGVGATKTASGTGVAKTATPDPGNLSGTVGTVREISLVGAAALGVAVSCDGTEGAGVAVVGIITEGVVVIFCSCASADTSPSSEEATSPTYSRLVAEKELSPSPLLKLLVKK